MHKKNLDYYYNQYSPVVKSVYLMKMKSLVISYSCFIHLYRLFIILKVLLDNNTYVILLLHYHSYIFWRLLRRKKDAIFCIILVYTIISITTTIWRILLKTYSECKFCQVIYVYTLNVKIFYFHYYSCLRIIAQNAGVQTILQQCFKADADRAVFWTNSAIIRWE